MIFSPLISLVLLILIVSPLKSHAEQKTYILGFSPGSEYHAMVRDRIKTVYQRAGLKAEFVGIPHKRSVSSANEGLIDGDVGRNPVVEKKFKNLRRINVKISESRGSAYSIRPDIQTYDFEHLKNYNIGSVHGVRWVQKKLKGLKPITVKTYPQLIKMLLSGRIDIAIGTELSMDAAIKKLGKKAQQIKRLNPRANVSPTYHFVHKRNKDIIPKLEKAIIQLKKEQYWSQ